MIWLFLRLGLACCGIFLLLLASLLAWQRQAGPTMGLRAWADVQSGRVIRSWADGSHAATLTRFPLDQVLDFTPQWSPDGRWLALRARQQPNFAAWLLRVDGQQRQRISPSRASSVKLFGWSPIGGNLLLSLNQQGRFDLYLYRLADHSLLPLTQDAASEDHAVWSPDGRWIAYTTNAAGQPEIYRMRPDGSGVEQLTHSEGFSSKYGLAWSPDGESLIFTSRLQQSVSLWQLHLATRQLSSLYEGRNYAYKATAQWSPNGRDLLYLDGTHLLLLNPKGSPQEIANDAADFPTTLTWLPGGEALVFEARDGLLYRVTLRDGQRSALTATSYDAYLSYSPPVQLRGSLWRVLAVALGLLWLAMGGPLRAGKIKGR